MGLARRFLVWPYGVGKRVVEGSQQLLLPPVSRVSVLYECQCCASKTGSQVTDRGGLRLFLFLAPLSIFLRLYAL